MPSLHLVGTCYLTIRVTVQLSASSAALDLALSSSPNFEAAPSTHGWRAGINRHRTQQSLSALNGPPSSQSTNVIGSRPTSVRHSLDFNYISENASESDQPVMSPRGNPAMATPPKLQSSFSSNDVPTVKNSSGMNNAANNHAQQHFHNHNASIGRIPAGAMPARHSRDLSGDNGLNGGRDQGNPYQSIQSALQASAAPFGPSTAAPAPPISAPVASPTTTASANAFNGFYPNNGYGPASGPNGQNGGGAGNYNVAMLTSGMQQMGMSGVNVNSGNMYPAQNYAGYGSMPYAAQANAPRDSQARVIQHRRQLDNEGSFSFPL